MRQVARGIRSKAGPDGNTGAAISLAPTASAGYDCTLANVPITFTGNTAEACGTDTLSQDRLRRRHRSGDATAGDADSGHERRPDRPARPDPRERPDGYGDALRRHGEHHRQDRVPPLPRGGLRRGQRGDREPGGEDGQREQPRLHVARDPRNRRRPVPLDCQLRPDGDPNNVATSNGCNGTDEDVFVIDPAIKITKTTSTPTIETGGTANFHIKVENTGNSTLTDVHVTDAQAPDCARTSDQIKADPTAPHPGTATFNAGDTYEYDCSVTGKTASFTNSATATGTPEVAPDVTSTDMAPVEVLHPAIEVAKNPKTQSDSVGRHGELDITVQNIGDTRLTNIISHRRTTGTRCGNERLETDRVDGHPARHKWLDPARRRGQRESFTYDCTSGPTSPPTSSTSSRSPATTSSARRHRHAATRRRPPSPTTVRSSLAVVASASRV